MLLWYYRTQDPPKKYQNSVKPGRPNSIEQQQNKKKIMEKGTKIIINLNWPFTKKKKIEMNFWNVSEFLMNLQRWIEMESVINQIQIWFDLTTDEAKFEDVN